MNSSLYQPLQTLFTSWQPTPRPRRPSLPRGRTENCKTNLNQRRWRRRWKRRVEQRLPTTTAPRTEPEKEGSVNRSVTSSPPPLPICLLTPALLYTLSLTPHPLPHSHPSILPCYHLSPRCQKEKRCGNTCRTTECSKPPPEPPPPSLLFHIFKTTEYDAKTNDQIENGVGELLMTVNP